MSKSPSRTGPGLARLFCAAVIALAPSASGASNWMATAMPLSAEELAGARGGFSIGGLEMNFAVQIQSMVKTATDQIALTTRLALAPGGKVSDLQSTATIVNPASTASITEVPGGVEAAVANATSSIVHRIVDAQVETLSTNTASNAVLSQSTQINLTLNNLLSLAESFAARNMLGRIAGELGRYGR